MKVTAALAALLLAAAVVPAQIALPSSTQRLEFDVASIKPSAAPGAGPINVGVHIDGARVSCTFLSLKDYLRIAYRVKEYQVTGPDWIASERFDIAATLPAGAPRDKVPEMLQALMADRFHVTLHREAKEFPVYALELAKGGPKMKESVTDPDAPVVDAAKAAVNVSGSGGAGGTTINLGNGSYFAFGNNKLEAGKLTMAAFAETLARYMDRPVVDLTELKANYDFTINFTPEDYRAMLIRSAISAGVALPPEVIKQALEGGSGDSLFTAVQGLGLRLERRKAPLEVVVIDSADRMPTAN